MAIFRSILLTMAAAFILSSCSNAATIDTAGTETQIASAEDMSAALRAATERAKATTGPGQPALWSINDDDTTVYLFGTIHLLRPETLWRSAAFEEAFAATDTVYLEVDSSSVAGEAEVQRLVTEEGLFKDGRSLSVVLDDSEETTLNRIMAPMGLTLDAVNGVKPWLLGLQISVSSIVQAGYDPSKGVDAVLAAEARRRGKDLKFLESAERQIRILSDVPMAEQVSGLMVTLETLNLGADFVDVLAGEWADGDVKGLAATMSDPIVFGSQEAYETIMVQRNQDWIAALTSALNDPGVKFVAVGTGHMVGPDSIITMLEDTGLSVTRLQ